MSPQILKDAHTERYGPFWELLPDGIETPALKITSTSQDISLKLSYIYEELRDGKEVMGYQAPGSIDYELQRVQLETLIPVGDLCLFFKGPFHIPTMGDAPSILIRLIHEYPRITR